MRLLLMLADWTLRELPAERTLMISQQRLSKVKSHISQLMKAYSNLLGSICTYRDINYVLPPLWTGPLFIVLGQCLGLD